MDFPDVASGACTLDNITLHVPPKIVLVLQSLNYRLSSLYRSLCDTLGLDNHPIAKYRYEPDTINHLMIRFTDLSYFRPETWSWDFGDGSPQENTRHPYRSYALRQELIMFCLPCGSPKMSSNKAVAPSRIGTSVV